MKRLAILGASGHGKVVADAAALCGWSHIDFFDDAWPERTVCGVWPVVGGSAQLLGAVSAYEGVIVAIGNNAVRRTKQQLLEKGGAIMATIIHPAAVVSEHVRLGAGSVVFATAVINPFCEIGDGAILNTGCSVDHDCCLGAFVHVSPGARLAGQVHVGDASWIGIGASVRQLISIGAYVTVGAGAAVVAPVADSLTVVGVPARAVRR
ncbi:acetyltransferase [Pseudomonas putida]|jgi:sugar O-acyltransferase (sialic acid O-acetyltransferase NeuD family)|uniref:acetyltransferase n=1 Tax=Pseudomonas putida group TaxID=136845 RepID=UPI001BAF675A|nr:MULTISPECIES: acetyltransferase [Pseudomonas putida group]EKT4565348.1 acetyltransferase [Pseudomonas putida]MCE1052806.1 acetyltransferase [Pseudomonas alloputida]MCE1058273.1 acetyltransferase [Pseudomonas alloputida]MCF1251768.1 acetyltransferase [Pseudomonas putida]MDD2038311.1 acetyltransferase [Pseudomonas putida]